VAERPRDLIRQICQAREVSIVRGSISPDHIHMLVTAPPQLSPAGLVQYVKGGRRGGCKRSFPPAPHVLSQPDISCATDSCCLQQCIVITSALKLGVAQGRKVVIDLPEWWTLRSLARCSFRLRVCQHKAVRQLTLPYSAESVTHSGGSLSECLSDRLLKALDS
jgi:hypothetical protein